MNYNGFQEKRVDVRFDVPIQVTYLDPDNDYVVQAQAKNISAKGLGLVTNKALIPGTILEVCLQMADNQEKIRRRCKVVWSNSLETGSIRLGVELEEPKLKPVPLVLRTIMTQRRY